MNEQTIPKKEEYLNEESYQQAKKKIIKISIIILIVGLVVGIGLMGFGFYKQKSAKKINEQRYQEAYKQSSENVEKAKKRLSEIATEQSTLKTQLEAKQSECDALSATMGSADWFANSSKCQREASEIRDQINNLESEAFKLNNADYTVYYKSISVSKYNIFYIIGGGIILLAALGALIFYLIAKRREIMAFGIQQTMPVAQESIEKMTPTIGSAAGTISQDIARGVTQGIAEGKNIADAQNPVNNATINTSNPINEQVNINENTQSAINGVEDTNNTNNQSINNQNNNEDSNNYNNQFFNN